MNKEFKFYSMVLLIIILFFLLVNLNKTIQGDLNDHIRRNTKLISKGT